MMNVILNVVVGVVGLGIGYFIGARLIRFVLRKKKLNSIRKFYS